jgi:tRNA threonylcarbamoyl adenosine modification protein YjeE
MSATEAALYLPDEAATHALGARLAASARLGDCLLLKGDLGAGKTALAKGFIGALAPGAEVTSPTFTLVQTYDSNGPTLWHFDLYRLKSAAELPEIGLEEALDSGITLIEWPELAEAHLPSHALTLSLSLAGDGRNARLSGGARWHNLLTTLNE